MTLLGIHLEPDPMLRWPALFLVGVITSVIVAFAADHIHAQSEDAAVMVHASIPRGVLEDARAEEGEAKPMPVLTALPTAPAPPAALTVEVVKPTWWDDLWGILLPLMASGGTYLGIWLWVQGRKLLKAQVDRTEERRVEANERVTESVLAHDTNDRVRDIENNPRR